MARNFVIYAAVSLALIAGNQASAQTPGGLLNMFTAMMGAAIVNNARIEWSKLPSNEAACIEEELRQRGTSIGGLIQNGIVPNDSRVAGVRFDCRSAALPPSNATPKSPVATGNLSERPTLDCSRARSLTAQTICLDRAGASADWDLITAYWARYFSLAEDQRQVFDRAQQVWLNSLNQNCPRTRNPRECVLTAYTRRAAAYRSQIAGDALAESRLTPEQHAKIQQSLIAFGFLDGEADGEFGTITRSAIRRLKMQSGEVQGDFLTATQRAELLQGAIQPEPGPGISGQLTCRVMDPTGTPLNVRNMPNGEVVDTLAYNTPLQVLGTKKDARGRDWALIKRQGGEQALGWAFREYLTCTPTQTAQAPKPPVSLPPPTISPTPPSPVSPPPEPASPPRIETVKLKQARFFLEDTKTFISQQKSVPSISEIAKEAASLQLALNQFDERGALESKQKLNDVLKSIPGFTEFEQQEQAKRTREEARRLTESRILAKQNEFFIDNYLGGHLGVSTTQPLLNLRGQLEIAVKSNTIEEFAKANDAVASYVKLNGLTDAYAKSATIFTQPEPAPPRSPGTVCDSLTEKSNFLCKGPADEILLLYNVSPSAPNVWKNVRGDVVFQDESASVCFAQPNVELAKARYVEHYLGDHGARTIASVPPPCDLSSAAKKFDIIAFQRGDLLKSNEEYLLALAKTLEADLFRRYETIKDYTSYQLFSNATHCPSGLKMNLLIIPGMVLE